MEENVVNEYGNTSGLGKNCVVPDEVRRKFNWGAFCFDLLWAADNRVWQGLLPLVLVFFPDAIGYLLYIIFKIWFGIKGNSLAWKNKKWASVEEFHAKQKRWAYFAIVVLTLVLISLVNLIQLAATTTKERPKRLQSDAVSAQDKLIHSFEFASLMGDELPAAFENNEELAKYASKHLYGEVFGNKVTSVYNVYEFFANGDCSNNSCYVIVDTNGDRSPNKMWEEANTPSDKFILYINRETEQNKEVLKVVPSKIISEYKTP